MTGKIRQIVRMAFSQGLSDRDLALALALGFTIGIFPVLGTTSLLCLAASAALRLNIGVMQAANWIAAPAQLLVMIPLMKAGGSLTGIDGALLSAAVMDYVHDMGIGALAGEFGMAIVSGVLAWALISVPFTALLYTASSFLIRRYRRLAGRLSGPGPACSGS